MSRVPLTVGRHSGRGYFLGVRSQYRMSESSSTSANSNVSIANHRESRHSSGFRRYPPDGFPIADLGGSPIIQGSSSRSRAVPVVLPRAGPVPGQVQGPPNLNSDSPSGMYRK